MVALSSPRSGAVAATTLFVDNVNGTANIGCSSAGAGACKTIQDGGDAAEALSNTAVTLDVAGSSTPYNQSVAITLLGGNTLDIEGTGTTQPTLDDGGTGSNIFINQNSTGAVTIHNMTISGGDATSDNGYGGGVEDLGTGTLTIGNGHLLGQPRA